MVTREEMRKLHCILFTQLGLVPIMAAIVAIHCLIFFISNLYGQSIVNYWWNHSVLEHQGSTVVC